VARLPGPSQGSGCPKISSRMVGWGVVNLKNYIVFDTLSGLYVNKCSLKFFDRL
jgi:hypothetical protein